jgi:hypothetical protein
MRGWLAAILIAGCAAEGRPIAEWRLEGTSTTVTLPSSLRSALLLGEMALALQAMVPLDPEERGRELLVVLDCEHGPVALEVDGQAVPDSGDAPVGAHRFFIPRTHRDPMALTLRLHRDMRNVFGFGTAPRLVDSSDHRNQDIAAFNRYSSLAALFITLVLAFLYLPNCMTGRTMFAASVATRKNAKVAIARSHQPDRHRQVDEAEEGGHGRPPSAEQELQNDCVSLFHSPHLRSSSRSRRTKTRRSSSSSEP